MTSKMGAKEETKKSHKVGQTRSKKKVLEFTNFIIFFFGGEKGCAGISENPSGGVAGIRRRHLARDIISFFPAIRAVKIVCARRTT